MSCTFLISCTIIVIRTLIFSYLTLVLLDISGYHGRRWSSHTWGGDGYYVPALSAGDRVSWATDVEDAASDDSAGPGTSASDRVSRATDGDDAAVDDSAGLGASSAVSSDTAIDSADVTVDSCPAAADRAHTALAGPATSTDSSLADFSGRYPQVGVQLFHVLSSLSIP